MKIFFIIGILIIAVLPGFGQEFSGKLAVAHPGFVEFRFRESYVYIFEINEYIEILEDGSFVVELLPGRYSLKTYAPGFEPTYRTVFFPEQLRITIPVTLQLLLVEDMTFERTVPRYLERIRTLLPTPDNLAPLDESSVLPYIPPVAEPEERGISGNRVGDFFRRIFGRNRKDDE